MAHDERDARLFAQGDNPPPRPHLATTTSYPHPSSTPKKCHPCARSKVSPMSPIAHNAHNREVEQAHGVLDVRADP
jgi:hypothetical protein